MRILPTFVFCALVTGSPAGFDEVHLARAQSSAPPAGRTVPTAARAVALVQHAYSNATAFTSDFEQRFWVKASNLEKTTQGHVEWRPNAVAWTYAGGAGSGAAIQCTTSQCGVGLWFLPGPGALATLFTFEVIDGVGMAFPDGYVLVGTPKTAIAGCAKALFYVDATSSQVRRILLLDEQGNRNRLDFQNIRISAVSGSTPASNQRP